MHNFVKMLLVMASACVFKVDSREAVVFLSHSFSDCLMARIQAVVETAGAGRDVWLLHPEEMHGVHNLRALVPGLHTGPQPQVYKLGGNIMSLGDARSKSTTAAFLVWLQQSTYSHAWYTETDTFFTGPWDRLFDNYPLASGPDLVSYIVTVRPSWYFWSSCEMSGVKCNNSSMATTKMTTWFTSRISKRLATSVVTALVNGELKGHHESVLFPFCSRFGFSVSNLADSGFVGALNAGGYQNWKINNHKNMTLRYYNVMPMKLYHPIKCQADMDIGHKALMWTRDVIPVEKKIRRSYIIG